MKAIIFAAGLWTRLKPRTDSHPKALAQVWEKSVLQIAVEYLQSHGIYDVIINTHHFADQIRNIVEAHNWRWSTVSLIHEEELLETWGWLRHAKDFFIGEENFVAINADILTDVDITAMIHQHENDGRKPLSTIAVRDKETNRLLVFNNDAVLVWRTNTKTWEVKWPIQDTMGYMCKAFGCVHVISTRIFTTPPRAKVLSIIDRYLDLCHDSSIIYMDTTKNSCIDIGTPDELLAAQSRNQE